MDTITLQVPIPKELKTNATIVAREYGFSSLQEIIRVLLTKLSRRQLSISVEETEEIRLSAAAKKRYKKMAQDFRSGKNIYHAKNIIDLFKHLHS